MISPKQITAIKHTLAEVKCSAVLSKSTGRNILSSRPVDFKKFVLALEKRLPAPELCEKSDLSRLLKKMLDDKKAMFAFQTKSHYQK